MAVTKLSKTLIIEDDVYDHHSGETFGVIKIGNPITGEAYGYVKYGLYQNGFHIKMIETFSGHQRKGYATKMMNYIKKNYKEYKVHTGMLTDDGAKFVGRKKK